MFHSSAKSVMRIVLQLFLLAVLTGPAQQLRANDPLLFEDVIQPILQKNCVECHQSKRRKADLDLSSTQGFLRGGDSGALFKAGDPEHSLLYEVIHRSEMPKKGGPLPSADQKSIYDWIEAGAKFRNAPKLADRALNQHDIIPIALLRCNTCHGPQMQLGGLVMNNKAAMLKGGKSGPAIIPGNPDESLAIKRIEELLCPPKGQLLKYFVKRPTAEETRKLREWIANGAPEADIKPDVASHESDPLVSDEDRRHWSFQPLNARKVSLPNDDYPIDAFVGGKLRKNGLDFSPRANRIQLIRRAYLDLTGLPPSPEELKRWREHRAHTWYAAMVDHLLESPRYGERWGRYWLDLAGYADSEGGVSSDPLRRVAWKYRDYVIKSFNDDKPYDRFLLEQIAGDELADYENTPEVTGQMIENLVATGFLRMGMDQTGSRTMNFVPERIGVIADAINVLGSGVMGLTLECAQCHSHKYDPIPHRDYYRLKATLQGAFDEHDWLSFRNRHMQLATSAQKKAIKSHNPPLERTIKSLESKLRKDEHNMRLLTLQLHYPDMPLAERKEALVAERKADNQRTLRQQVLAEKVMAVEVLPDSAQPPDVVKARKEVTALKRQIAGEKTKLIPSMEIRALWDRGRPSPTYILRRGEYNKPGRLVGPGVPAVLTDGRTPFEVKPPFPNKSGRRLAFAKWLTTPDHPLTSRVIVNRIWFHHFGAGLVGTLENFGLKGDRPTHPELLDWLAQEFVREGWSIKSMHRLIMRSRTYQQASAVSDEHLKRDPQNKLVSRMPLRRMDAEALRDSLLFVSGRLDTTAGGPADAISVDHEGQVTVNATKTGNWRRSVYSQYRRTEIPTMMGTFDYPVMGPNCVERSVSVISPQSLMLLNNNRVRELSKSFAERVSERAGKDAGKLVDAVYELAISRPPAASERKLGVQALSELHAAWHDKPEAALETYCHTILNSAAFIYID